MLETNQCGIVQISKEVTDNLFSRDLSTELQFSPFQESGAPGKYSHCAHSHNPIAFGAVFRVWLSHAK